METRKEKHRGQSGTNQHSAGHAKAGSLSVSINPGDLRVAEKTCAGSECHAVETKGVGRSMMTHGAMLWGAALYNNGGFPIRDTRFGESYSPAGGPQRLIQTPAPNEADQRYKGLLQFLDPIPRWGDFATRQCASCFRTRRQTQTRGRTA